MLKREDVEKLELETLMRRALALAEQARAKGNHPFGALLCDRHGRVVLEAENTVGEEGDVTRHAELNLMSLASRHCSPDELNDLVMVTSTEPCPMCTGAAFWTGVRSVVFGLSEKALREICTNDRTPDPPVLALPCREVFATSPRHPTIVIGPVLETEARIVHEGFW